MNIKLLLLLVMGIWMGMLVGISFVEAPLKFRAPNITLALGLGIGRIVFGALNKFELVFSIVLIIGLVKQYAQIDLFPSLAMGSVVLLVVLQTLWLIPILDTRAESIIQGVDVPRTYHHLLYIIFEVVKLILLMFGFVKQFYVNEVT